MIAHALASLESARGLRGDTVTPPPRRYVETVLRNVHQDGVRHACDAVERALSTGGTSSRKKVAAVRAAIEGLRSLKTASNEEQENDRG